MGYPISAEAVAQLGYSCQFSRCSQAPLTRSRASQRAQLGNGWHIGPFTASSYLMVLQCSELGRELRVYGPPTSPSMLTALADRLREKRGKRQAEIAASSPCVKLQRLRSS